MKFYNIIAEREMKVKDMVFRAGEKRLVDEKCYQALKKIHGDYVRVVGGNTPKQALAAALKAEKESPKEEKKGKIITDISNMKKTNK